MATKIASCARPKTISFSRLLLIHISHECLDVVDDVVVDEGVDEVVDEGVDENVVSEKRMARDAHNNIATAENENQNPAERTASGSIMTIISAAKLSV